MRQVGMTILRSSRRAPRSNAPSRGFFARPPLRPTTQRSYRVRAHRPVTAACTSRTWPHPRARLFHRGSVVPPRSPCILRSEQRSPLPVHPRRRGRFSPSKRPKKPRTASVSAPRSLSGGKRTRSAPSPSHFRPPSTPAHRASPAAIARSVEAGWPPTGTGSSTTRATRRSSRNCSPRSGQGPAPSISRRCPSGPTGREHGCAVGTPLRSRTSARSDCSGHSGPLASTGRRFSSATRSRANPPKRPRRTSLSRPPDFRVQPIGGRLDVAAELPRVRDDVRP